MSTLLFNNYQVQTLPQWMREERYMYCEPMMSAPAPSSNISLWKKIKHLFA